MGHAYTPGLKVTARTTIRKRRRLPIQGEVVVKSGAFVQPDDVVARTELPGDVFPVNIANQLGLEPREIGLAMLKKNGDAVSAGEKIAESKSFFGLFRSEATSPIDGTVENISTVTGQVILRGRPLPVEVNAYIPGQVVEVEEGEGVVIETSVGFIQGIFGVGGETGGELALAVEGPNEVLDKARISENFRKKVIVAGRMTTAGAVRRAVEMGVAGIVTGGLDDRDLRDFLGYDLGVAITGQEKLGVTLLVTEGFGDIAMAEATWNLLKKHEGRPVSINGATQIRAGVIRPEVIIPLDVEKREEHRKDEGAILKAGMPVRCIRTPYFGRIGKVGKLPAELATLESETKVRVLEVVFQEGERAIVPRANVEVIEG